MYDLLLDGKSILASIIIDFIIIITIIVIIIITFHARNVSVSLTQINNSLSDEVTASALIVQCRIMPWKSKFIVQPVAPSGDYSSNVKQ